MQLRAQAGVSSVCGRRAGQPSAAFRGVAPSVRTVRSATSSRSSALVCRATVEAEAVVYKGDLLNKTYYPTALDAANVTKKWFIIDAQGQTLGRLATLAATYIRGKHLPTYSPSMDMGAYVIVINAEKVTVTGKKFTDKTYFRHGVTGRPGSWKIEKFKDLQKRIPERIVEKAVQGMLPKGRLGKDIRLHLKVFKGPQHPHIAQQPKDVTADINAKPSVVTAAAAMQ